MSLMELVESLCLSFRWRGHMLSTQSIRSTYTQQHKTKRWKERILSVQMHLISNYYELLKCFCFQGIGTKLMTDTSVIPSWSAWTYRGRSPDQVLQLGVTELQADDIIQLLSLRRRGLVVTCPLGHGHLCPLLSADIHHIYHTSAPWLVTAGKTTADMIHSQGWSTSNKCIPLKNINY